MSTAVGRPPAQHYPPNPHYAMNNSPGPSHAAAQAVRRPKPAVLPSLRHSQAYASSSRSSYGSAYKVERHVDSKNGRERDVIVIEDTPPVDSADLNGVHQPPAKKARVGAQENGIAKPYQYPSSASLAANGRKASGTKRKYDDTGVAQEAKPKALPVCDDKEGHYIIRVDDELGERYKIIKLLGQGTFGKVVECWDKVDGTRVAVKVIRAIQKYRDASKVEIKVLNLLRDRDPHNLNKCIHLLDYFDHRNHICIVSELLSASVFDFLKDNHYNPFPASHIQSFAKQLLKSVAFLHDLHLIHTDLKPENILLVNKEYDSIPCSNARGSKTGPKAKTKRILKDSSIHLIDFGSATFEEEYHASIVSTRHYRAPEIILGMGWSYPCDVWSIGCILIEFFTGDALFQTHENLEHLAMMEVVFGKMPDRYASNASRLKPEFFNSRRQVDFPTASTSKQSKKFVKAMRPLGSIIPSNSIVNARFVDLLEKLLEWDPFKRITVREALKHPYFALQIDDEGSASAI